MAFSMAWQAGSVDPRDTPWQLPCWDTPRVNLAANQDVYNRGGHNFARRCHRLVTCASRGVGRDRTTVGIRHDTVRCVTTNAEATVTASVALWRR